MSTYVEVGSDVHALIKELAIKRVDRNPGVHLEDARHSAEGTEIVRLRRRSSFDLQQALSFRTRHHLCIQVVALVGNQLPRSQDAPPGLRRRPLRGTRPQEREGRGGSNKNQSRTDRDQTEDGIGGRHPSCRQGVARVGSRQSQPLVTRPAQAHRSAGEIRPQVREGRNGEDRGDRGDVGDGGCGGDRKGGREGGERESQNLSCNNRVQG